MADEMTVAETIRQKLLEELDAMIRSPREDEFARELIDRVLPAKD